MQVVGETADVVASTDIVFDAIEDMCGNCVHEGVDVVAEGEGAGDGGGPGVGGDGEAGDGGGDGAVGFEAGDEGGEAVARGESGGEFELPMVFVLCGAGAELVEEEVVVAGLAAGGEGDGECEELGALRCRGGERG